jgi:hypothetical protein
MSKKEFTVLPAGCTQEMVDKWKSELGQNMVKVQTVESSEELHEPFTVVTRVPGRRTMEMFQKFMDRDPGKANDILKNDCILFGKEQLSGNEYKELSVIEAIAKLIPTSKIVTKNL